MLFKDLKQNYPVFILNKQELTLTQGKVTSMGFPRLDINQHTGKSEMVVDITIEAEGKSATYVIPENLTVTYANNLIISTDKHNLVSEIEAMKNNAQQALASMDYQKAILEKSSHLLEELSPVYKEKQETEKRFKDLEDNLDRISSMMEKQGNMLSEMMNKFRDMNFRG